MKRFKIKLVLSVVGGCVLLLLAVNYLAGEWSPPNTALDAALAACRAQGWPESDLAPSGYQVSNNGMGSAASIALKSKAPNRPKTIRVPLRKRLNLLGWEVVAYHEE